MAYYHDDDPEFNEYLNDDSHLAGTYWMYLRERAECVSLKGTGYKQEHSPHEHGIRKLVRSGMGREDAERFIDDMERQASYG